MQRQTRRAAGPANRQTPWKRPYRTQTIFDTRRSARSAYIWRRDEIQKTPQNVLPGFAATLTLLPRWNDEEPEKAAKQGEETNDEKTR